MLISHADFSPTNKKWMGPMITQAILVQKVYSFSQIQNIVKYTDNTNQMTCIAENTRTYRRMLVDSNLVQGLVIEDFGDLDMTSFIGLLLFFSLLLCLSLQCVLFHSSFLDRSYWSFEFWRLLFFGSDLERTITDML